MDEMGSGTDRCMQRYLAGLVYSHTSSNAGSTHGGRWRAHPDAHRYAYPVPYATGHREAPRSTGTRR